MDLSTITVKQFKDRFYRDFQFKAVQDAAIPLTPDPDFVQDQDIQNAFADAQATLNQSLYGDDTAITLAYLLLSAHCLCLNLQAADASINSSPNAAFSVASRGVGSENESYQIPDAYKDDPLLALYAQTSYGAKFLTMTLPALRGNMKAICGATLP